VFLNGFLKDHILEGILITGYVILFTRTKVLKDININRIQAKIQKATALMCKNNDKDSNLAYIFSLYMRHVHNFCNRRMIVMHVPLAFILQLINFLMRSPQRETMFP